MTSEPFGDPTRAARPDTAAWAAPVDAPVEPHLADLVVAAVLQVPGVAAMHAGMFGEVATYLPHRQVDGVQLHDDATQVHVVVRWGASVPATAQRITDAVAAVVDAPVHVTVEDIESAPDDRA